MVRDELLAQTADPSRVSVEGTHVTLAPKAAEVLTLAIHELATNAAKYGAIRAPAGELAVHWRREQRDGQAWMEIEWRETRGEIAPEPNRRKGFGTASTTRSVPNT